MPSGQQDRTLVAGVDSSTQSTKVVVCDAATGEVLREGRAAHPDGTEVHPDRWWDAYRAATAGGLLDGVAAVGVGGQQHGMVALDEAGDVVRPALLWNDTRSAQAARDLVAELGGAEAWADAVGLGAGGQLHRHQAALAGRARAAPRRPGGRGRAPARLADREDPRRRHPGPPGVRRPTAATPPAPATGPRPPGSTARTCCELAFGRVVAHPARPRPRRGRRASPTRGMLVSAGTGDNMAAAPRARPASPATSWSRWAPAAPSSACHRPRPPTPPARSPASPTPPAGFLPLVCTLNAARVLTRRRAACSAPTWPVLERLALEAAPGAGGLTLLPYLDGERTPDLPHAAGTLGGHHPRQRHPGQPRARRGRGHALRPRRRPRRAPRARASTCTGSC